MVIGTRTVYLLALMLWAAFVAVGSLVPFDFHPRPWSETTHAFVQAMTARPKTISKSDTLVNFLLGMPLGFLLLGACFGDASRGRLRMAAAGVFMLPACVVFSAAVEFAQLYLPDRTCSGLDVVAQVLGAAAGMTVWVVAGRWLTEEFRKAAIGASPASQFLVAYLLLLGLNQMLPLDFDSSPADAYRKFRDGGVNPIPFSEFHSLAGDSFYKRIATVIQLAGLYIPLGLIASRLRGRAWFTRNSATIAIAGFGLALCMELGQVLVKSRTCNATDVVVGCAGVFLGWSIGSQFRHRLKFGQIMALGAVWGVALLWLSWQPFRVGNGVPFDWIPGMPLNGGNPMWTLEAILRKLILFGLAGALAASRAGASQTHSLAVPVVIGLIASAVCEAGQSYFVGHTPGITDVLLGGLGALCGAWTATRVRT